MYQIDFRHPVHVFFVGIGGISMSGLAEILLSRHFTVSGSDRSASAITDSLQKHGIRVLIGQKYENITPDIDLVVFTSAIHPDNPEYKATMDLGIPHLMRAELLGQIMKHYREPVAISGTHGKTTTTSMLSEIMVAADTDPTLSIGGILDSIGGNVRVGGQEYFIAEACEYTNSFLSMFPKVGVILDIDADHLDFFKDLQDIRRSFRKFAELVPADGALIINSEIPNTEEITGNLPCRIITYGAAAGSDYWPTDIAYDAFAHPTYTLHTRTADGTVSAQQIKLSVPGIHNVYNSMAAAAAADLLGVDRAVTAKALEGYRGTERRFELIGQRDGFTIIDDYAHHPTEIEATLQAAQHYPHKTLWCVFQSHTFSRTKALMKEFARALTLADRIVLADIYPARETDTLGISAQTLAGEIRALGHECTYLPSFEKIEEYLLQNCQSGDLVITMGAGNVNQIAKDLVSGN